MKISVTILFIIFIALNTCSAQDTVTKNLRLLKESVKIDSLISSVIMAPSHLEASKNDSCFLLGLFKSDDDAGFIAGLHVFNHKKTIIGYANFYDRDGLGYFEFRGYLVFVYGDSFKDEFFKRTKLTREFTFITPTANDEIFLDEHYRSWAVFYDNDRFGYGVH